MSFGNPALLFGLLGAGLPVLIHLINRRRPRKQPFPAMELLLKSVRRVERTWRLRRWVLLAARVLLLAAFVLAAARPSFDASGGGTQAGSVSATEDVALVIDASLSMRARFRGQTAFARALDRARRRLARLGPDSRALIVAAERTPRLLVSRPTADRGRLLGALRELEPTFGTASLAEAISAAARALASQGDPEGAEARAEEPKRGRRIVVLSDLARPAVDGAAILSAGDDAEAELEVVDVLSDVDPEDRVNDGVAAVLHEVVPDAAPRTVAVTVRVRSHRPPGDAPRAKDVELRCDEAGGPLEESFVDVAPGALSDRTLTTTFERTGVHRCAVELARDPLAEDDVRYGRIRLQKQVRVLIVDGDPSGVAKEDETYYLDRALEAGASDHPAPRIVGADDLRREDLEAYDVVVLAGVAAVGRADAERLVRFVRGGGGLFVTAAPGLDVGSYNRGLGGVLPRDLRGEKLIDRAKRGLTLSPPSTEHPVLELFTPESMSGLVTTRTHGFLLLQPGAERPMTTLLAYENGAPAMVVASADRGRVALLTTSIDRDWSDLPIRPAFVPLMRRVMLWLGAALDESAARPGLVSDPVTITVPEGATRIEVVSPTGATERRAVPPGGGGTVELLDTRSPGHYRVLAERDGRLQDVPEAGFVVNVDPLESDLRPVPAPEARAVFRGESAPAEVGSGVLSRARVGRRIDSEQITAWLLAALIAFFVLESALTALRVGR
mgnify:CR=1 FL=1